jgi:hypothetical protein
LNRELLDLQNMMEKNEKLEMEAAGRKISNNR